MRDCIALQFDDSDHCVCQALLPKVRQGICSRTILPSGLPRRKGHREPPVSAPVQLQYLPDSFAIGIRSVIGDGSGRGETQRFEQLTASYCFCPLPAPFPLAPTRFPIPRGSGLFSPQNYHQQVATRTQQSRAASKEHVPFELQTVRCDSAQSGNKLCMMRLGANTIRSRPKNTASLRQGKLGGFCLFPKPHAFASANDFRFC